MRIILLYYGLFLLLLIDEWVFIAHIIIKIWPVFVILFAKLHSVTRSIVFASKTIHNVFGSVNKLCQTKIILLRYGGRIRIRWYPVSNAHVITIFIAYMTYFRFPVFLVDIYTDSVIEKIHIHTMLKKWFDISKSISWFTSIDYQYNLNYEWFVR